MRKGIKLLAAIVAAATASTMSLSAFAATYTTTTVYVGDKVTVTTEVTGAKGEEEVAYLVHKADAVVDALDSTTIYYIDQKTASAEGTAEFSFTADKSIAEGVGSVVKAGTTSQAYGTEVTPEEEKDGVVKVAEYTVTYSVSGGNGTVYAVSELTDGQDLPEAAAGSVKGGESVSFLVVPAMGYQLSKVTVDGVENASPTTSAGGIFTATITKDCAVTFEFAAAAGEATATTNDGTTVEYRDVSSRNTITAFAKATGAVKEAGILFSMDQEALAGVTDIDSLPEDVKKFSALAIGSDGSFAIRLVEDMASGEVPDGYEAFITAATGYARAYVVESDGSVTFGDVK